MEPFYYRNRIQLRAEDGKIGFLKKGSSTLVAVDRCDVARKELNEMIPSLLEHPKLQGRSGLQKIEIDVNSASEVRVAVNRPHAAFGFRQVNDAQNEKLKSWIGSKFPERGHFLDLYGGRGNLSLPLVDRMAAIDCVDVSVPGNDESPSSTFRYHSSAVLPWLGKSVREEKKGKLGWDPRRFAVLDPPREGLGNLSDGILESLDHLKVEWFALVGCDADSFARDVARITKAKWILKSLAVFDFFPQTPHVESAALFVRPI